MNYKIFQVETGETEWWMATSKEQVQEGMESLYGADEFSQVQIKELSDSEIEKLSFRTNENPENDEEEKPARQMADEYISGSAQIKGKDVLPYLLASTCF